MINLFDSVSQDCSKLVTNAYSTSFSMATKMLDASIRNHIYNIYGFVRFASQVFEALVEKSKYEKWKQFGRWPEGVILLQDHGDKVSFKNIKIREF